MNLDKLNIFRAPAARNFEHKQGMATKDHRFNDLHNDYNYNNDYNNKSNYQGISELITDQCISKYD